MIHCKDCNCLEYDGRAERHSSHNTHRVGFVLENPVLEKYAENQTIFLGNKTSQELLEIYRALQKALR